LDCGDLAVPDRFKRQHDYIDSNCEVSGVGGYIGEFDSSPDNITAVRKVPETHTEIKSFSKRRMPVNFPTFTFRRDVVEEIGGFRDLQVAEDYEMVLRLIGSGFRLANIPEIVTKMKAGEDLIKRRGGLEYLRKEARALVHAYNAGGISRTDLAINLAVRTPVRLLPNRARQLLYQTVLRD
jgi:GT2 family glycosyltransferase